MPEPTASPIVRIWDLPLRLFHWLLVLCVIGAFVTVKVGGFWMDYHLWFGYAIMALLVFRVVWGFVGPRHARFTTFVRGPRAVYRQLRGATPPEPGHSPLGALSVMAILLVLAVQVGTGLFANDGIMIDGPLARYVSAALSDTLTGIHQFNEPVILVLIALHLLAIAWYVVVRRRRLIMPMITGDKKREDVPPDAKETRDDSRVRLWGLLLALAAAALAWRVGSMGF